MDVQKIVIITRMIAEIILSRSVSNEKKLRGGGEAVRGEGECG